MMLLRTTLESLMDSNEIKPADPKRNQLQVFTGRTHVEAEAPGLLPPDMESQLTGKDHDAGKDCEQEEKRATEDEMVGWYHQLTGHEFEKTQEVVEDREACRAAVHGVSKSQT